MLHVFSMLPASNIFRLSALIAANWSCGYIQYSLSFLLHFSSRFVCFNKIPVLFSQVPCWFLFLMLSLAEQILFDWAPLFFVEFHTVFNWPTITRTCLPSFAPMWLKTVIPSVLAGRWHVSLNFLTQIFFFYLNYLFFWFWEGLLDEHLLNSKNDNYALLLLHWCLRRIHPSST